MFQFNNNAVKLDNSKNLRFRDIDGNRHVISIHKVRTLTAVPYNKNKTGAYKIGAANPYELCIYDRGLKYKLIYSEDEKEKKLAISEPTFNAIVSLVRSTLLDNKEPQKK